MAIFHEVHEAIISKADWERVQLKRGKTRKRKKFDGEKSIFSGIIVCADCGHNLWFHFNQKNHDITYFSYSNYKDNCGTCETTHYIRMEFLEQVVLGEIKRLVRYVTKHGDDFIQAALGSAQQTVEQERQQKQKELRTLEARDRKKVIDFPRPLGDVMVRQKNAFPTR